MELYLTAFVVLVMVLVVILGANENGPTFANQNEPTRIAVILVQQPTANFI